MTSKASTYYALPIAVATATRGSCVGLRGTPTMSMTNIIPVQDGRNPCVCFANLPFDVSSNGSFEATGCTMSILHTASSTHPEVALPHWRDDFLPGFRTLDFKQLDADMKRSAASLPMNLNETVLEDGVTSAWHALPGSCSSKPQILFVHLETAQGAQADFGYYHRVVA